MLTSLKFGYHYTVITYITCGPMWLLSSGLHEERTGRRCETLKGSERLISTIMYRQVGFFLFTAAFFPLNMWGLIWRKSKRLFFYFLAKFLFVSYVFALIGNLGIFLAQNLSQSFLVHLFFLFTSMSCENLHFKNYSLIYLKIRDAKHFSNTFATLIKVKM